LDHETIDALKAHRELVGEGDTGLIFTTQGGSRGKGGMLARNNFARVWNRAKKDAKLADGWTEHNGLHFHDLRHTHATWLIAQRVPMIAVAKRLGHAYGLFVRNTCEELLQAFEDYHAGAFRAPSLPSLAPATRS